MKFKYKTLKLMKVKSGVVWGAAAGSKQGLPLLPLSNWIQFLEHTQDARGANQAQDAAGGRHRSPENNSTN